ncbi:MAG: ABC transporter permease [Arcanobacterium sp.]|nr:ABC transporter permease [Arcanobacterium sp.]
MGTRVSLRRYLAQAWQRRYFTIMESRARAFGSIKDTFLGKIWLVLNPFLDSVVYYVIFSVLLNFGRGMQNFVGYLVIGVISFGLLTRSLGAYSAIEGNGKRLVQTFAFPKISMILSFTLRNFIDFVPTYLAMLVFIAITPPHAYPTLTWLITPVIYLAIVPFCIGLSAIVATVVVIMPDIRFIINLFSRFWFYGSGVFWSIDMMRNKPLLQDMMRLNPGWATLNLLRNALLANTLPTWDEWAYLLAWSFGLGIIGILVMWANDQKIAKALVRP